jgi:hypothetical protein
MLPPDWQEGREPRSAITIDGSHLTVVLDNVLSVTPGENEDLVHISVADPTAFMSLADNQAMLEQGRRYMGKNRRQAMPGFHTQGLFSMKSDGQDHPSITLTMRVNEDGASGLTIARERVRVEKAYTMQELREHARAEDRLTVDSLVRATARVRAARFRDMAAADKLYNFKEMTPDDIDGGIIVQEITLAASALMAEFMHSNNLSALYNILSLHPNVARNIAPRLRHYFAEQVFSTGLYGHIGADHKNGSILPFMSPLRDYPSRINHYVLDAFMRGTSFPDKELAWIAQSLNKCGVEYQTFGEIQSQMKVGPSRLTRRLDIEKGAHPDDMEPGDLARIFFGNVRKDAQTVRQLRINTARYLAQDVQLARTVLYQALADNLVTIDSSRHGSSRTMFVKDWQGNRFSYLGQDTPLNAANEAALLFARVADIDVNPALPSRLTEAGKILSAPHSYLKYHAAIGNIRYVADAVPQPGFDPESSVLGAVEVTIDGEAYRQFTVGGDRREVLQAAGAQLITRLDLINRLAARQSGVATS